MQFIDCFDNELQKNGNMFLSKDFTLKDVDETPRSVLEKIIKEFISRISMHITYFEASLNFALLIAGILFVLCIILGLFFLGRHLKAQVRLQLNG